MNNDLDKVIIVDSNNKYVSKMDKYAAHRHPAKLHQAVSIWLLNDKGQVLLQKRSSKKIVGAGWWANAICGNVRPTEIYSACAIRRLREEIGVEGANIKPVYKFVYKAFCNQEYGEHEFDQVYVGKYLGDFILNPEEVEEVSWVDLNKLVSHINTKDVSSPNNTLIMSQDDLEIKTKPIEFEIDGVGGLLAPWTCMMLKDNRLTEALKNFPA